MIGGRVWMSHAWLIAWRSAPITPLAATINSRIADRPEPARVVERVAHGALELLAVAVLRQRHVVEDHHHDPLADVRVVEEQAEAADEQHRERDEREHREERDLRRVAMPAVVDELQARVPQREQHPFAEIAYLHPRIITAVRHRAPLLPSRRRHRTVPETGRVGCRTRVRGSSSALEPAAGRPRVSGDPAGRAA